MSDKPISELLTRPRSTDAMINEGLAAITQSINLDPMAKFDDEGNPIPLTFVEYVNRVMPKFIWHRHNRVKAQVLQDVADGKYGEHARIVIIEPPRHGKTEEVSKLFSSYWLYRFGDEWVGLVTYGSELAFGISSKAQEYYKEAGGVVVKEPAAEWVTSKGGGMWAAGIGGPITGKGFNLGIIDDPVKNSEEAQSELTGKRNKEWYQSTFYSREAPRHTAIIVQHTRWPGPGDMIGWLFEQEGSDEDMPERWHVVYFEAMKEDTDPVVPATCTLEPDWRAPGEALCPGRYDEVRLHKIKKRSGPYFWASIWQGRPRPREGGAFKETWFEIIDINQLPPWRPGIEEFRYWDLGGSEDGAGGDPSVGVKIRWYGPGEGIIVHVARFFKTPKQRDVQIAQIAENDGLQCTVWGPQDPATAGKAEAWHFRTNLAGFKVHTETVTGNIQILAGPYQSALEGGMIKLLRGPWNRAFIDEHLEAWTGSHDDQIWAAANAYLKCVRKRLRRNRRFTSYSMVTLGT